MGLFQHRPEEEESQWTLPSEPVEHDAADILDAAPSVDSLMLGMPNPATSIVFPVAAPAPEASDVASGEPED
jgi:hypothetical protein